MLELHLKIFGNVQGVNFRYYTFEKAQELNLTGWVKNAADGSLEILAQGDRENLEKLTTWARKGPRLAKVESLEVKWQESQEIFNNFQIKY